MSQRGGTLGDQPLVGRGDRDTVPESQEAFDEEFVIPSSSSRSRQVSAVMVPDVFTSAPPVRDGLVTETSTTQDKVVETCLAYLVGGNPDLEYNAYGVPHIDRNRHVRFLHKQLGPFPAPFITADASRPWFLYWSLNALAMLGEDPSAYASRLAETARSMQNPSGGFGGGHGQLSHLATTYAVVLALALCGDEDAYAVIDRKLLWRWLCSLKQPDGGFRMSAGGEEDIRGAFCAAVIISLLELPLDLSRDSEAFARDPTANLFTGLADYVRRCQTFEGGISGQPDAEAHGAYAFCALGCLSILGNPDQTIPRYLDVPRLISWLSSRQYAPEGGFSGRTNKLVDGCYSHWVGGCWPLIEACLTGKGAGVPETTAPETTASLFSREGLIRYILSCCQDLTRRGGLRDKPGMPSDAYHSCYVLAGLSAAENHWHLISPSSAPRTTAAAAAAAVEAVTVTEPTWMVSPFFDGEVPIFDEEDRVGTVHPVYVIPEDKVVKIQAYFSGQEGF